jgi:hypothetical protein
MRRGSRPRSRSLSPVSALKRIADSSCLSKNAKARKQLSRATKRGSYLARAQCLRHDVRSGSLSTKSSNSTYKLMSASPPKASKIARRAICREGPTAVIPASSAVDCPLMGPGGIKHRPSITQSGHRRANPSPIRAQAKLLERLVDQQAYDGTDESHHEDASSRYGDQVN